MHKRNEIHRREFLKRAAVGAAALSAPLEVECVATPWPRRNVIIILADDMGYGDLRCYGSKSVSTPHIDALAAEGLRFTDFHSNGAVCSPTRAALLTGRYQQRCGIEDILRPQQRTQPGLPLGEVTFAQFLKSHGYVTGMFGKWHLGYPPEYNPIRRGFGTFRGFLSGNVDYHSHVDGTGEPDWWNGAERAPEEGYTTDLITSHGVDFIKENKAKPFCLYLAHAAVHAPYQTRADKPFRLAGSGATKERDPKSLAKTYGEMIAALDDGVGRIVETLRQERLERETFIFFCSDNGAIGPGSTGGLNGKKGRLLEGGHRVPAIAYMPGFIAPGETRETAMTMDVFPTLAAMTGYPLPTGVKTDGVDLTPLLIRRAALPERALFWRTGAANREKAVRKGAWKLRETGDTVTLFNLDDDPKESRDRAAGEPERLAELKRLLAAWEKDVSSAAGAA